MCSPLAYLLNLEMAACTNDSRNGNVLETFPKNRQICTKIGDHSYMVFISSHCLVVELKEKKYCLSIINFHI